MTLLEISQQSSLTLICTLHAAKVLSYPMLLIFVSTKTQKRNHKYPHARGLEPASPRSGGPLAAQGIIHVDKPHGTPY